MLAKNGLLIVSNPKNIGSILAKIQNYVKATLYIQPLTGLSDPFGSFHPKVLNSWPKFSQTIFGIYSQAAKHCYNLDVRVLLSGIKYDVPKIQTQNPIDLVIFDKSHSPDEVENFIKGRIQNVERECGFLTLESGEFEGLTAPDEEQKIFSHAVLGGTFDRLHIAHKVLLSDAALRSKKKITIGVTNESMIQSKLLWELIEDINVRLSNVKEFLSEICPELEYDIVEISNPFGPAIVDPTMEVIVVSAETVKGGEKINEIRLQRGLQPLEIVTVDLIDEPNASPIEEKKISSSTTRIRLLGTLLKPVQPNTNIPNKPYIIGLTGGIASGKSGVAENLEKLGALVINCDIVGHSVYKAGKPCHKQVVDAFGTQVLGSDGEINRKALGEIVFKDPEQLKKLNNIVWPGIMQDVQEIIKNTDKEIVVIEAAVLLLAGWQKYCHEVWSTFVPKEEAIRRLIQRNNLTEEQAKNRLDAQPTNKEYVNAANVVFSPYWEKEYTREQVLRAWRLLQKRLPV